MPRQRFANNSSTACKDSSLLCIDCNTKQTTAFFPLQQTLQYAYLQLLGSDLCLRTSISSQTYSVLCHLLQCTPKLSLLSSFLPQLSVSKPSSVSQLFSFLVCSNPEPSGLTFLMVSWGCVLSTSTFFCHWHCYLHKTKNTTRRQHFAHTAAQLTHTSAVCMYCSTTCVEVRAI